MKPLTGRQRTPSTIQIRKSIENIVVFEYKKLIDEWKQGPFNVGKLFPFPIFEESDIISICKDVKEVFKLKAAVVQQKPGRIIVGDIFGNIYNLLQIFSMHGLPPAQNYIFLGNYINVGDYSLEVLVFLLSLYYLFPTNVTLLRGPTEFCPASGPRTLASDIESVYGPDSSLKSVFFDLFTYMPIACLISDYALCSRSSLISRYASLDELFHEKLPIPCVSDQNQLFLNGLANIIPNEMTIADFREQSHLLYIILGGKLGSDGVSIIVDDSCYIVASDSSKFDNGVINLVGNQPPFSIIFRANYYMNRDMAEFKSVNQNVVQLMHPSISSVSPELKRPSLPSVFKKTGLIKVPSFSPQPKKNDIQ